MTDHMARVEQEVRRSLRNAHVLAAVEVEFHERPDYWERAYIVAWVNEREHGTHRVCIDSNNTAACMWGHYLHNKDEALTDFMDRSGLDLIYDKVNA